MPQWSGIRTESCLGAMGSRNLDETLGDHRHSFSRQHVAEGGGLGQCLGGPFSRAAVVNRAYAAPLRRGPSGASDD